MEKVNLRHINNFLSRFIVLTNKNLYAFTSDDKDADCTMNVVLKNCGRVETSDDTLNKQNTFVKFLKYIFKNLVSKG